MQKKSRNAKKRQKMHFNLKIHAKKDKNRKKESTFIWIVFDFISLVHFKPKNSYKKDKNAKKKQTNLFKFQTYICKKKSMK